MKSGQDQLHQPKRPSGVHEVNFTNFTFMVENFVTCNGCGKRNDSEANFCSKCGGKLSKRNWTVVGDTALGATTTSSESDHPLPPRPMRDLRSVEVSKAALGKTSEPEKKVKLKPVEVLGAMDQLSKEEKKALKILLSGGRGGESLGNFAFGPAPHLGGSWLQRLCSTTSTARP